MGLSSRDVNGVSAGADVPYSTSTNAVAAHDVAGGSRLGLTNEGKHLRLFEGDMHGHNEAAAHRDAAGLWMQLTAGCD